MAVYGSFRYGQYFEDTLAGIVAAADAAGVRVISIQTSAGVLPSSDEIGGQGAVSRIAWDHFDAAIILVQAVSLEYVAQLRAAGKFLVQIGQDPRGSHAAIAIDNQGGVRDAVSHLAEHGHTRIGFLSPGWQIDSGERYAAYCARMEELGLEVLPMLGRDLPREPSMDHQGYQAAQQFLLGEGFVAGSGFGPGERTCTALLVAPDLVALGFIRGLRDAGARVPEDVAVIGIDDVDEAAVSAPPLATVAISFKRVGEQALRVALDGSTGRPTQPRYLVPERLIPRESCGCPSASDVSLSEMTGSPAEALASALVDAAQEREIEALVDVHEAAGLARRVVDLLDGPDRQQVTDLQPVTVLAQQINELCPLDRAVQRALRAIRALSRVLAESAVRAGEPDRSWAIAAAALDLCDAIRSGQLQRRMSEHVDLKRLQVSHYFIGNSLLGHDRDELRSLAWLEHTPVQAGVLGLWTPNGQTEQLTLSGVYRRGSLAALLPSPGVPEQNAEAPDPGDPTGQDEPKARVAPAECTAAECAEPELVPVEAFPPPEMLVATTGRGGLVVITQVRFEDSDWGILAVVGDRILQSSLVQETFHQWSILMSASLDQEQSDAEVARQAAELTAAYQMELDLLEEVRVSEERYALAAEAARDALWDWDIASSRVFYSGSWKALLGHRENEIGTSPDEWLGRIHPEDADEVRVHLERALKGIEQYLAFEHRLRTSSGDYRWLACSGRSVADDSGRPVRLVGSITDVTARRLLQEQLMQEALHDELTGLAKSTLFKDLLNQAIDRAKRRPEYWFAVLYVDLNGFKAVNDSYGHAAGDELLAGVADRLKESLRADDTAARLGGDEFGILLNDVQHIGELGAIVDRIHARITAPYRIRERSVSIGAAIGVAVSDGDYPTAEAMLHDADTAMYRVKHRARAARAVRKAVPEVRLQRDIS